MLRAIWIPLDGSSDFYPHLLLVRCEWRVLQYPAHIHGGSGAPFPHVVCVRVQLRVATWFWRRVATSVAAFSTITPSLFSLLRQKPDACWPTPKNPASRSHVCGCRQRGPSAHQRDLPSGQPEGILKPWGLVALGTERKGAGNGHRGRGSTRHRAWRCAAYGCVARPAQECATSCAGHAHLHARRCVRRHGCVLCEPSGFWEDSFQGKRGPQRNAHCGQACDSRVVSVSCCKGKHRPRCSGHGEARTNKKEIACNLVGCKRLLPPPSAAGTTPNCRWDEDKTITKMLEKYTIPP